MRDRHPDAGREDGAPSASISDSSRILIPWLLVKQNKAMLVVVREESVIGWQDVARGVVGAAM